MEGSSNDSLNSKKIKAVTVPNSTLLKISKNKGSMRSLREGNKDRKSPLTKGGEVPII